MSEEPAHAQPYAGRSGHHLSIAKANGLAAVIPIESAIE